MTQNIKMGGCSWRRGSPVVEYFSRKEVQDIVPGQIYSSCWIPLLQQNMGFSNLKPTTLNLKLVTFCTVQVFNMPYVQPRPWQCFSANGNFKNRYSFMCFTAQIIHNPGIGNIRPATKNSGVRSVILLSASLKIISLCPKYSVWSPSSVYHLPGICATWLFSQAFQIWCVLAS